MEIWQFLIYVQKFYFATLSCAIDGERYFLKHIQLQLRVSFFFSLCKKYIWDPGGNIQHTETKALLENREVCSFSLLLVYVQFHRPYLPHIPQGKQISDSLLTPCKEYLLKDPSLPSLKLIYLILNVLFSKVFERLI